jgi:tetratricopeptide (TPR) repeat protein
MDTAAELVNIAELYDDLKEKGKAWAMLDEALEVAEAIPDEWFRVERLIEIADTYSSTGNEEKALQVLSAVAPRVNKIEQYSLPYFLLRMAGVYIFLCENSEAIEILKSIPAILNQEETAYERAGALIEIAEKYLEISQNVPAVELIVRAIALAESITDPKEKIAIQIEAAGWLDEAEHLDEARKLAARANLACQLLTDKKSSIFGLGNLAILYVYLKDIQKAAEVVEDIIRIVQETSAKTSGLGSIGEELAAEGQPELALGLAEIIKEPEIKASLLVSVALQSET